MQKNLRMKFCFLTVFLFFMIQTDSPLSAEQKNLKISKILIAASSNNFPPMNALDKNGNLVGFGREISDAAMKAVGVEIKHIHSPHWVEVLEWLSSGQADFIHDAGYTKAREEFLDYSKPIIEMPEMIFVRTAQFDISGLSSLEGKKVACVNQHISHLYLQAFPKINCYVVNSPAEGVYKLIAGDVDAFVYPEQIVLYLAQQLRMLDKIKVTGEPLRKLSWSMVVKKGNTEVRTLLNKGIDKIKKSGEYERIYNKWWGKNFLGGYSKFEVFIIVFFAVIVAIGIVLSISLFLHTYKLRLSKTALEKEILHRQHAETALRESEKHYRAIAEDIPVLICRFMPDGKIVYVNEAYCEYFHRKSEELVGQTFSSLIPEDDRKMVMTNLSMCTVKSPTHSHEHRVIAPDGKICWHQWTNRAMFDEKEELTAYQAIGEDITDRKQAEIELQSQKKLLEGVLDSIKDVIGVQLPDHTVLQYNKAGQQLFGRTKEEMKGKKCYELIGKFKPCEQCATSKAHKSKKIETIEKFIPEFGRYFLCTTSPILDEQGNIKLIIEQLADITEKKKMDEQLKQAQRLESIGRLAGGIAHDFNNMLAIILGNTEIILEDIDPATPFIANLNEIQRAAGRSADLTRQLLAFARKQTVAPRILNLNETLEGMLKMLQRLIGEDIDLAWYPNTNLWPVKIDPSQVDQILTNLCVNARDSIKSIGKITIETDNTQLDKNYCREHAGFKPGNYALMTVSDNGCGMNKETLENLFEPFYTTKDMHQGTGLGLATVYGIVKQNNGFIHVYSEPGHGTTFKIFLPRHIIKEPLAIAQQDTVEATSGGSEVILLVEDEKAILRMTTMMLERLGYTVFSASSPSEAIRIGSSKAGEINLLMTDVVMPGMSGREMARKLLKSYPDVKCLFMSGYTENVIAHHGVLDKGIHFIHKPFGKKELAAKLRDILDEK